MAKMSRAQARNRLIEARLKFKKVYMAPTLDRRVSESVKTSDMEEVDKIVTRCLKRLGYDVR